MKFHTKTVNRHKKAFLLARPNSSELDVLALVKEDNGRLRTVNCNGHGSDCYGGLTRCDVQLLQVGDEVDHGLVVKRVFYEGDSVTIEF